MIAYPALLLLTDAAGTRMQRECSPSRPTTVSGGVGMHAACIVISPELAKTPRPEHIGSAVGRLPRVSPAPVGTPGVHGYAPVMHGRG